MGTLKQLVSHSYSRHKRKFTAGIALILEYSTCLDVSFLALSEDKFFTVTKKMGKRLVIRCSHMKKGCILAREIFT